MAQEYKPIDMDKYRRVRKEREDHLDGSESKKDEIRISAKGRTSNYISYAGKLFNEEELTTFTLKATGQALSTAVTVAEIIKRRFKGIHQLTKIGSIAVEDEYEPKSKDSDLENIKQIRNVSFIEIILSKDTLDEDNVGYQKPISDDLVEEKTPEELQEKRGGKGKKGKGKGKKKSWKYDDDEDDDDDDDDYSPKGKGKKGKKGKGKKGKDSKGKGKKGKDKGKGKKGKKGKGKGKSRDYDSDEEE